MATLNFGKLEEHTVRYDDKGNPVSVNARYSLVDGNGEKQAVAFHQFNPADASFSQLLGTTSGNVTGQLKGGKGLSIANNAKDHAVSMRDLVEAKIKHDKGL